MCLIYLSEVHSHFSGERTTIYVNFSPQCVLNFNQLCHYEWEIVQWSDTSVEQEISGNCAIKN